MEDATSSYRDSGIEELNISLEDIKMAYTPLNGDGKIMNRAQIQKILGVSDKRARVVINKKVASGEWEFVHKIKENYNYVPYYKVKL
jgi:Fic family protein